MNYLVGLCLYGFRPSWARWYADLKKQGYVQSVHGFNKKMG